MADFIYLRASNGLAMGNGTSNTDLKAVDVTPLFRRVGEFGPQDSDIIWGHKSEPHPVAFDLGYGTLIPLLVTTFSPGFLDRTSMAILLEGENGSNLPGASCS
jgi:hypothetical protein